MVKLFSIEEMQEIEEGALRPRNVIIEDKNGQEHSIVIYGKRKDILAYARQYFPGFRKVEEY